MSENNTVTRDELIDILSEISAEISVRLMCKRIFNNYDEGLQAKFTRASELRAKANKTPSKKNIKLMNKAVEEFEIYFSYNEVYKQCVERFACAKKKYAPYLDIKYWDDPRKVRKIKAYIEKGKANTVEEAIALLK